MPSYNIAEKFVSINGEGRRAGQLAVFIRFFGCNLRCSYCDTAWAWPDNIPTNGPGEQLSNDEIYQFIKQSKVRNVTLTGGEPLRQPHILTLLEQLQAGLAAELQEQGWQLTARFSPGYGDLPLDCQAQFCATLDAARRIGLTVSSSGLLLPRKSVTAVIGLAQQELRAEQRDLSRHNCAACRLLDCPYRRK